MSRNVITARKGLVSALALAACLGFSGHAQAADLGGDCCADLEERVAELEATTVRKGNRKVSLTVSGWVAEQVMWWDDGVESNAYVVGTGATLASHFKLTGQASIAPGYQAGYVIHVETQSADPFAVTQSNDDATLFPGVSLLQSYWFLNSDRLGKLSVGKLSHASDNAAILVDGSGSLVPANWLMIEGSSFGMRVDKIGLSGFGSASAGGFNTNIGWGAGIAHCQHISAGIGADCNGIPLNAVRYDSPVFNGFSVSASWGEDDFWDVAGRYAGEFNGVKVALSAAYSHQSEEAGSSIGGEYFNVLGIDITTNNLRQDSGYLQLGGYIHHVPTGLFVYGAYGKEMNDAVNATTLTIYNPQNPSQSTDLGTGFSRGHDNDHWYIKAGLRRKWSPLGHTVLYGEYGRYNDMYHPALDMIPVLASSFQRDARVDISSEMTSWGLGAVQEIDAAAMSLWLTYRNYSGELNVHMQDVGTLNVDFEDLHIVKFGALINF